MIKNADGAARLVRHVADALTDPLYPDAEYLRHNVARVLSEGTRKGRHESARNSVVWQVCVALRGTHGDYVRGELSRVLRDDALRVKGVRVGREVLA